MAQFLLPLCNAHGGPTWGQFHLSYLPLIGFFPHVRKEISGHPGGLTNHPYVRKSTRDTPLLAHQKKFPTFLQRWPLRGPLKFLQNDRYQIGRFQDVCPVQILNFMLTLCPESI